jgi:hypothetical protein
VPGQRGPDGPQGIQGQQGPQGIEGPEGPRGNIGPRGTQGPQGIVGPPGPVGSNGPAGPRGDGLKILDSYETLEQLNAAHPTGLPGDMYLVGNMIYVWSQNTHSWKSTGILNTDVATGIPVFWVDDNGHLFVASDSPIVNQFRINFTTGHLEFTVTT